MKLGKILGKVVQGADKLLTDGKISEVINSITGNTQLTEEERQQALKELDLYLADVQNARDNETARDNNENSSWLSKNIHELIGIALVLAFIISLWYTPIENGQDMIERTAMCVLTYLYGRSQPDKR